MLTVGSLFSGVGGIDLGLERAGMRVVFQCEKDAGCRGILAQHWPNVPCFDDVREVSRAQLDGRCGSVDNESGVPRADRRTKWGNSGAGVDLLCGGFPCQDLSVAGKRAGLAGDRSGLFFEFARIADELVQPKGRGGGWVLLENVPGLLSSNGGRDFAVVLATLADIGFHDLAWRVLDSRYFGVPQRRRRVFIVGRRAAGDGARQVLLEPESGGGDFTKGAEARTRVAASLVSGSHGAGVSPPGRRDRHDENIVSALDRKGGGADDNDAQAGHLLVSPALVKRYGKGTDSDATDALITHTLTANGFDASEDGTGRGTPLVSGTIRSHVRPGSNNSTDIICPAPDPHGVRATSGVPGRVDDPRPDGPRYAAMGNAVTVNVIEWIGRRIVSYEETSQ